MESLTAFAELRPLSGDRAIYAAPKRLSWDALLEESGLAGE